VDLQRSANLFGELSRCGSFDHWCTWANAPDHPAAQALRVRSGHCGIEAGAHASGAELAMVEAVAVCRRREMAHGSDWWEGDAELVEGSLGFPSRFLRTAATTRPISREEDDRFCSLTDERNTNTPYT
jgi:hypothetical protein